MNSTMEGCKTIKAKTDFVHFSKRQLRESQSYSNTMRTDGNEGFQKITMANAGSKFNFNLLKNQSFKAIPNATLTSNTWDAKHLDKFILSKTQSMRSLQSHELYGSANIKVSELNYSLKQKTIDNNLPRFDKENFKKKTFNDYYDNQNIFVVQGRQNSQGQAEQYYQENFTLKPQNFYMKDTNYLNSSQGLQKPNDKRQELQQTLDSQSKLQEWKKEKNQILKRLRVQQSAFRSGILGIDNPQNPETQLYQKTFTQQEKIQNQKNEIMNRHKDQVKEYTKTHNDIAFFNKNHLKQQVVQQIRPAKKIVENEFITQYQNSKDRLFGAQANKYSLLRAQNIRDNETHGRNFDIICNQNNKINLKIDQGVVKQ